jgi:hypothetical protein
MFDEAVAKQQSGAVRRHLLGGLSSTTGNREQAVGAHSTYQAKENFNVSAHFLGRSEAGDVG